MDWQSLPHEVLSHIFIHLPRCDLAKCSLVCKTWYSSANDDLLWKRLLLTAFKLPSSTVIRPKSSSWKSELQRLIDQVPNRPYQTLQKHTDEVLHVQFSHDGTELVSCSKDANFIVWTDDAKSQNFYPCFVKDMSYHDWNHTWTSQFSPDDSKLMVSGVVAGFQGEIAIFNTGRGASKKGHYTLLARVVNDPYDMLGCWCSNEFFLSATYDRFDFNEGNVSSIWLSKTVSSSSSEEEEHSISLESPKKILIKFANQPNADIPDIYARFLRIHSRKGMPFEDQIWMTKDSENSSQVHHEIHEDDMEASVDLPSGPQPDLAEDAKEIIDNEMCVVFIHCAKTYIPHEVGFKRIKAQDLVGDVQAISKGEKVIELHGHIVGMAISPDQKELYVNVRSWPDNYVINSGQFPPCISQQIEIKVINLETIELTNSTFRGHMGFTPTEEAFYLYLDVSELLLGSGSEDKKGYIWDRHYKCKVATLPHEACVNSVAFRPTNSNLCATASDDCSIKIWQSGEYERLLSEIKRK